MIVIVYVLSLAKISRASRVKVACMFTYKHMCIFRKVAGIRVHQEYSSMSIFF